MEKQDARQYGNPGRYRGSQREEERRSVSDNNGPRPSPDADNHQRGRWVNDNSSGHRGSRPNRGGYDSQRGGRGYHSSGQRGRGGGCPNRGGNGNGSQRGGRGNHNPTEFRGHRGLNRQQPGSHVALGTEEYSERMNGNLCNRPEEAPRDDDHQRRAFHSVQSVIGTVADGLPHPNFNVFSRYDFEQKNVDTTGLTINQARADILVALANHQVLIVEGFTGCGKTTQVPQFILDEAKESGVPCRIAVTQPRRIAAMSVANRVCEERGWPLGGLVGYQVGLAKEICEDTCLTYMTTGMLTQILIASKDIKEWSHIIIDEVHERDLDTDLLLLVIHKILIDTGNTKTKIILMSATLNAEKFGTYFMKKKAANVVVKAKSSYPIKEIYLDEIASKVEFANIFMTYEEPKIELEGYEMASKIIQHLDEKEEKEAAQSRMGSSSCQRGAVLVFLPGLLEIETLCKVLEEVNDARMSKTGCSMKWLILPLHSTITSEEQQRVFVKPKDDYRKIILATNIAESSITVADIKYVIDFCLTKSLICDQATNYTCLRLGWASKNQCIQRRGRCGRVAPGTCYRMVSEKFYSGLFQEAVPEMQTASLETVVLQVKLLDMGSPRNVLALAVDPPDVKSIGRAVANLKEIGALTILQDDKFDAYDGQLTFIGRVLSRLPIDIRLGRMIILGHAFDCLEEAVIIAAGLSVKSPFAYPYNRRLESYMSKLSWAANSFSDCVAILNLYTTWYGRQLQRCFDTYADEKLWAKNYFVQVGSLREIRILSEELFRRLETVGITVAATRQSGEEQKLILKLVLAGGFYPNYFLRSPQDERQYAKDISRELFERDPFTSVAFTGVPPNQPPELFEKTIAKKMAYGSCIPSVLFEGNRAIITFDSRNSNVGLISRAVYRALKFRHLRESITFASQRQDKATEYVSQEKAKIDRVGLMPCPAQVLMPDLKSNELQATVTYIANPSEFYVILQRDQEAFERLARTLEMLRGELDLAMDRIGRDYCVPGQLCIANVFGKYYRARIECEKNGQRSLLVFLIDHGLTVWLKRERVYKLNKRAEELELHKSPAAMAIRCRLAQLRPCVAANCVWPQRVVDMFMKYCQENNNQIILKIYSVVKGVIAGTVRNSEDAAVESINDILESKKLADKYIESEKSKKNNEIRRLIPMESRKAILDCYLDMEEKQNVEVRKMYYLDPPKRVQTDDANLVTLRGPYTPLEMSFHSICYSAHLKEAVTEGSSVNSVVLDQDPREPCTRLLVSASVSIAVRSGKLMARDTTLLPAIPGLCGLLSMMFCPKMELRVDNELTEYTGCVTGLGVDPNNVAEGSVYPDHDMEIMFDAEIDDEDIELINSIRSSLNTILTDDEEKYIRNKDNLGVIKKNLRTEALKLIKRPRKIKELSYPATSHAWNEVAQELFTLKPIDRDNYSIFPIHSTIRLNPGEGSYPEYYRE